MPAMTEKRISVVPDDPQEVEVVKRVAKILRFSLKDLVLASIRRGIREIILDLESIDSQPLPPDRVLAASSIADLKSLVRGQDDPTPYHPPPAPEDETLPPAPAKQLGDLRSRPQTRESKRGLSRLDKTGKKTRGRSEGIGG